MGRQQERWPAANVPTQSTVRQAAVPLNQPMMQNAGASMFLGAAANLMMNAGAFSSRAQDSRYDAYKNIGGSSNMRRY